MPEFGWTPNPEATEAFVARLPAIYGDQLSELVARDDGRDALNYRALTVCLQRSPLKHWLKERDGVVCVRSLNQGPVGTCVGNAEARLLDVLAAIEIVFGGEREEFRATFSPEGLYGLGREKGHMLGPGDGLYGAAIADAVREWGTLHQLVYDDIDLRTYSASRCRDYGRRGVPKALKTLAAEHRVTHAARVNTTEEGWALLGAGYTINMCSSLGFRGSRDAEGVIRRRGSWSHSMAVTSRRTTQSGNRLVLVHQSWGDNWTDGPYWQDMPWGSFWIHLADFGVAIGQRDSFAHASYQGFVPRQLPDFGTKEYLG
jgi:hypothetical protein